MSSTAFEWKPTFEPLAFARQLSTRTAQPPLSLADIQRGVAETAARPLNRATTLPAEAEWEYACRAGSQALFAVGDDISPAQANFLYNENGVRIGPGGRTRVGNYPPNAFGLYDFHGNVGEWVADTWHPNYLAAPDDGGAWVETGDNRRVVRGGSWDYLPRLLRRAWRDWRPADQRADNIGFCVAARHLQRLNDR
jgi:formylglycine-generating enzyme required for sulfatase activity